LEIENEEVNGHLWYLRYPLSDRSGELVVATTRPETMLGDTGVAVNPNDERYQAFIGKTVTLPILGREIPIFADELVDPAFGTGCVKVTPAHDPNDFEMGKRHQLPFINILNKDGTLNENGGIFAGQDRFDVRKNLVKTLDETGFLVKVEDYKHTVPYSDRGKVPVEPLLSTQWFVKIEPLASKALQCLDQENSPRFVPERWSKVYRDWLIKLKDWCISRQLWWGHQIPAWYVVSETEGQITDHTPFIVANNESEALEQAKAKYGDNCQLEQDPDVLDTWFSSGLWPFSTMGWPDETKDLATYYPNATLVTGFDIIFFWVARMTMMAGHFTGEMPFKDVYIHGLVRDEKGKKMSKSANNGIDPLILIRKYGTDALRYTLIREVAGAGQDISLQYSRKTDESESVEASRNFANKLWNATRFVMMNLEEKTPEQLGSPNLAELELGDRWILSRLNQVIKQTRENLETYGLGEAAKGLYEFIWGDFCDWYIELVKPRLWADQKYLAAQQTLNEAMEEERPHLSDDLLNKQPVSVAKQTLAFVLEQILKLLHPFMPHITEELWHTLTQKTDDFLALQPYPILDTDLLAPSLEKSFSLLFDVIREIRSLRAEAGIKQGAYVPVTFTPKTQEAYEILIEGQKYIESLAKTNQPEIWPVGESPVPLVFPSMENVTVTLGTQSDIDKGIAGVVGPIEVLIPLQDLVDVEALKDKYQKKLAKIEKEVESISSRLNNPTFVGKAPESVIAGAKANLAEAETQGSILRSRLARL
jgi:valyl-tRNA synthetase